MRSAVLVLCLTVLFLSVCPASESHAERASTQEMEQVCRNWLTYMVYHEGAWAGSQQPRISAVHEIKVDGTLLGLCFSIEPHGHVVVPILKELPPIKAYSEKSRMDVTQSVGYPQLIRDVLHNRITLFTETYGSLDATQPVKGDILLDPIHRREWDHFSVNSEKFVSDLERGKLAPMTKVGPLLTTSWHQQEPFNYNCPMGDGGQCVVGCTATAVAQIVNYHEWPPTGIGRPSYWWGGDNSCGGSSPGETLSVDLRDPFDWANMADSCYFGGPIDECIPLQDSALAELCYDVGVGLHSWYGYCGTAASLYETIGLLEYYLKYDTAATDVYHEDYTPEAWFALIQEEINAGRPILYLIVGHAIVCDGWRDKDAEMQYHMNYGWGGYQSGWYVVDHLYMSYNPDNEAMVKPIMPDSTRILWVDAAGSGSHATIQAAVDAAATADVILLANGTYTGAGNRDIDFQGKRITVKSVRGNPDSCIIDCEGQGRAFLFQSGERNNSFIEGITITNGSADNGGAIYCDATFPSIYRCIFSNNSATLSGGALYCANSATPELLQCTFVKNSAGAQGGAIASVDGSGPTINHTIVAFSTSGEAVYCGGGGTATFTCCDIYGNAGGDWVGCIAGQLGLDGNISEDPLFCNIYTGDFSLAQDSPCVPDTLAPYCAQKGPLGIGCAVTPVADAGHVSTQGFSLLPNVPNPFNPVTEIAYTIPSQSAPGRVTLTLYSCLGQRVRTLVDVNQPGGMYTVVWDGTDENGTGAATGVYFAQLRWNERSQTRKMVLVK